MKKKYVAPANRVIELSVDSRLLAASAGNTDSIEVGISNEEMGGAQAFSYRKSIWDNEDFKN